MLTSNEANILNNDNPTAQSTEVGTEIYDASASGLYYLECNITADATGEKAVTVPFACEIVDVIVQCRAANVSGAVTVKKGATAVTDAIIMAVDKVITRAGTIDDAQSTLAKGGTLTVDANGANDRGLVIIVVRKV